MTSPAVAAGTGRSNGMEFDKAGNLIACADLHGELWKITPNGSLGPVDKLTALKMNVKGVEKFN